MHPNLQLASVISLALVGLINRPFARGAAPPAHRNLPGTWEAPVWKASLEEARTLAKEENRVVFIAANIDNEVGNQRMLSVYEQPSIVALASNTVNLVSSVFNHDSGDAPCKRFGSVTCEDHRSVELEIREKYLEKDDKGNVIAPQHIFLGPKGDIILTVSWEITQPELEWCFVTALRSLEPKPELNMPEGARAPYRLTMGGVSDGSVATTKALSPDELKLAIKNSKKTLAGSLLGEEFNRMLVTDQKAAIKHIRRELDTGILGMIPSLQVSTLATIGAQSPTSFHEAVVPLLKNKDHDVRNAAVVALEQLAAPDSMRALKTALSKEKSPTIKKNILRALGTTGSGNSSARSTLLKFTRNKDALLRRNALIGLGSTRGDEKVDEALLAGLSAEEEGDRWAAALAIGFARRVEFEGAIRKALETSFGDQAKLYERVLNVLEGGNLKLLANDFTAIGRDSIRRTRFFGL